MIQLCQPPIKPGDPQTERENCVRNVRDMISNVSRQKSTGKSSSYEIIM